MEIKNLRRLYNILEIKQKNDLFLLLGISFFSLILESLGVISIIPIINSILSSESYFIKYFKNLFNVSNEIALYLIFLSVLLIYLSKFFISTYTTYLQKKIASNINADITKKLFEEYINKPYIFHVNKNSASLIKNLQIEVNQLFLFIESFFMVIVESIILSALIITLIFISPIGLLIFSIFSAIGFFSYKIVFFKRGVVWGNERKNLDTIISKTQLESFKGIKEIRLNNLEHIVINFFNELILKKAILNAKHLTSLQLSRYLFEFVIIIVVIVYLLLLTNSGYSTENILSMIGVFGIAAVKIIPSISKIMNSLQGMNYFKSTLNLINSEFEILRKEKKVEKKDYNKKYSVLNFDKKIELRIKNFGYKINNPLFENFKLELFKNEFLGISAKSGMGKSTLLNLFTGILDHENVEHLIDGKKIDSIIDYSNDIGYVSQSVYLFDESINFNISLKKDSINKAFIDKYKQTKLLSWVEESGFSFDEDLGEGGSKISGGQMQRIGIARALYKSPKILILDEPTASLDENNEKDIYEILNTLKNKISIIIVSHKKANLKICDRIIYL